MLQRTITLLGLTITVGALLLTIGCGGSNSNPVAPVEGQISTPSRGGQPPSAPSIVVPKDGTVFVNMPVTFMLRASDPENDPLKYQIELQNGNSVIVYDQTQNPKGWRTIRFGQYEWAVLTVNLPPGNYQWKARAFDGSNWGPYTNPTHYFTVR
jgi:hypothetical protein